MKKILTLSAIVSILILGCGSGGGSDSGDKKSIDGALKIGDVAYSTPTGIDFGNKMRTNLNKMHKKAYNKLSSGFHKATESCSVQGTMSYEESSTNQTITYDECIEFNEYTYLYEYYDGELSLSTDGERMIAKNYWFKPNIDYPNIKTFMNVTLENRVNGNIEEMVMDGEMKEFGADITEEMTFDELVFKENHSNKAFYIKGEYSYKGGCLDESNRYNTIEWLIPSSTDEDIILSGTIIVDDKTYIYNSPDVTVKYGDKNVTFTQSDLNAEIENMKESDECSI